MLYEACFPFLLTWNGANHGKDKAREKALDLRHKIIKRKNGK